MVYVLNAEFLYFHISAESKKMVFNSFAMNLSEKHVKVWIGDVMSMV
jgi:hypothetical protein